MIKRIKNPWLSVPGYCCPGCCPTNDKGLQLEFFEDGDDVVSYWEPDSQYQSCVMQTVHMTQAFVPDIIARGEGGRIVVINSECAALCEANNGAYASAKRGLDGLVRVLAKELGAHNITVNQVAPGWTITENDRRNRTEVQPEYDKTVPLGRRGTDTEIAQMCAFLASPLASFTTGAYIPVSGGRVMPAI